MASPQLQHSQQQQIDEPMVDAALSSKRPSLCSPSKKRKLSADEPTASPTSSDEVSAATPEEAAISPKKKARAADPVKWECLTSSVVVAEEPKEEEDDDKLEPLQFEPTALSDAPAQLSDEELSILQFFIGA